MHLYHRLLIIALAFHITHAEVQRHKRSLLDKTEFSGAQAYDGIGVYPQVTNFQTVQNVPILTNVAIQQLPLVSQPPQIIAQPQPFAVPVAEERSAVGGVGGAAGGFVKGFGGGFKRHREKLHIKARGFGFKAHYSSGFAGAGGGLIGGAAGAGGLLGAAGLLG